MLYNLLFVYIAWSVKNITALKFIIFCNEKKNEAITTLEAPKAKFVLLII